MWTRDELEEMDQTAGKVMTMHNALHPRDDVDRLYVSRKEGGRGLFSIEDSVDVSIKRLEDYIQKQEGWLITAIRNNTDNTKDKRKTITGNKNGKKNNTLSVLNNLKISEVEKTWTMLRKGNFKRETESLPIAAQNEAIRTNHIKARIDKDSTK